MFITISKKQGGRYVFAVGDDPNDGSRCWLHSFRDTALMGDTPTTFSSFGEAHAFASRIVDDRPSSVMARKIVGMMDEGSDDHREIAEGDVVSHYAAQVDIIYQRAAAALGTNSKNTPDELNAISQEIEGVKGEVSKLSEISDDDGKKAFAAMLAKLEQVLRILKARTEMKTASADMPPFPSSLAKAAIRAFSEAAMLAIRPLHDEVFVKVASTVPSGYETILSTPDGDVVNLAFDRKLLLSGVYPCGKSLSECGGLHSESFMVRYWEPIVSSVGHFYSKGNSLVAVPGIDTSKRSRMSAFGMNNNARAFLSITRPVVIGTRTWVLKREGASVTNPTESDIGVEEEVECTNPSLTTYYGRTGSVVAVNQKPNMTLCRVDFRRGIGPVWLDIKSVRKVNLGT